MPRTVRVVFGLPILFTTVTKTWRAFMSAYLHGQPSFRAVFFRLQVVLHEQGCIQIKTIGLWPVLQSTKNVFEEKYTQNTPHEFHEFHYVSRHHLRSVRFQFSQMETIRVYRTFPWQQIANISRNFCLCIHFFTGQKPWTDLTMAVPVSDHAWQQTMRKASR